MKMQNKSVTKDQLIVSFESYLSNLGLSENSQVNYISDLKHFEEWLLFKARAWGVSADNLSEAILVVGKATGKEYREFLTTNQTRAKTINRRLSSLRRLSSFLLASQVLDFDFMAGIENIQTHKPQVENPLIRDFQRHLEEQNVSKNTIKNYLSDVRQFLSWIESQEKVSGI